LPSSTVDNQFLRFTVDIGLTQIFLEANNKNKNLDKPTLVINPYKNGHARTDAKRSMPELQRLIL